MKYRVWKADTTRAFPALDGLVVQPGDVVVVAIVRDLEHATDVMQALNADDVRAKLARGKK